MPCNRKTYEMNPILNQGCKKKINLKFKTCRNADYQFYDSDIFEERSFSIKIKPSFKKNSTKRSARSQELF